MNANDSRSWTVIVTNDLDGATQVVVLEETSAVCAQVAALHEVFHRDSWRHCTAGIPVEEAA